MTGQYRDYKPVDFGHRVTDDELERLKARGVIEDFDQAYVWIYALPEEQPLRVTAHAAAELSSVCAPITSTRRCPPTGWTTFRRSWIRSIWQANTAPASTKASSPCWVRDAAPFNSLQRRRKRAAQAANQQFPALLKNAVVAFTENAGEFAERRVTRMN